MSRNVPNASGLRRTVAERDGWACAYCGCPLIEWADALKDPRIITEPGGISGWDEEATGVRIATLDHVDALLRGRGRNSLSNLALACLSCNSRKGDRPAKWMRERVA